MMYLAGFDVSAMTLGNISIGTTGEADAVVDLDAVTSTDRNSASTSLFFHHHTSSRVTSGTVNVTSIHVTGEDPDDSTRLADWATQSYAQALEDTIQALTTWTVADLTQMTVDFDPDTGFYTVAHGSDNITITWAADAGREFMGFAADVSVAAQSSTGTQVPTYAISPTLTATDDPTPNYEPPGIANRMVASDGTGYGLSRPTSPLYRDWEQVFEVKAKSIRRAAASTHPWTFQHLYEHCRGQYPFIVYDGFGETGPGFNGLSDAEAFSFRTEGTFVDYAAARHGPGNDSQFRIPFRTIVEGVVEYTQEVG